jgi:P2 family phage contractile tail tube protein
MPTINDVPEKLINFKMYEDGTSLVAMADVELPEFELMSETLTGSGLAGELDSPTLGHTKAMTMKINFRALYKNVFSLMGMTPRLFDLRGSIQAVDAALGNYTSYSTRMVVRGVLKKKSPGKFEPGKPMGNAAEISASYVKLFVAETEILEVDVLNFIHRVDGVDALASVRAHLGMTV